jgi:purine nucleosidase/pyrimidine-specific ribonucleoside hydrolase
MTDVAIPIVYDTDLGEDIDDLYALYLALFHPRIKVLAVTTVHGDTQAKARLAAKVLRKAGFPDIPVGAGIGMSRARIRKKQVDPDPKKAASFVNYIRQEDAESGKEYPSARSVIEKVLRTSPDPVTLVIEGAFSNISQAISRADVNRKNIRGLAAMAGETQRVMSEYNVVCDPESADVVFSSGLPVFMGTFDITARLRMTMADVQEAFGVSHNPVHQVLYDCTQLWWKKVHGGHKGGPVLYDLVPIFWLANQESVETRSSSIRVELHGKYTRGQTVRVAGGDSNVIESLDLDADGMVKEFVSLMKRAAPGEKAGS